MKIITHQSIDQSLCGRPLEIGEGFSRVELNTLTSMAADTSVVLDNKVLGKAEDKLQAGEMLKLLSGRRHYVYSAVAIATINNEEIALSTSTVNFRLLSEPEITDYCDTGEPVGKAGAYAIQGRAAAFVERMEGSYSGVVGLPIYETARLLQKYARGC